MRINDILSLQEEFARAFRDARVRQRTGVATTSHLPAIDLFETGDAYHIECDLPGARREDIRVIAADGAIRISGVRRLAEGGVTRRERRLGPFARLVPLPSDVDLGHTSASFREGVLSVRVGRRTPSPTGPVRIQISS